MPVHDWERTHAPRGGIAHPWDPTASGLDHEAYEAYWGEVSDGDTTMDEEESGAGHFLVEKLLALHLSNKISAEDCCVCMHYAAALGASEAQKYAMPPWPTVWALCKEIAHRVGLRAQS